MMLKKFYKLLNREDKSQFKFLVFISFLYSGLESIAILGMMPFISIIADRSLIKGNVYYNNVYTFLGFNSEIKFILYFGYVLIIFYVIKGTAQIGYSYLVTEFKNKINCYLGTRLFEKYLRLPYVEYVKKNSSDLQKMIINETPHVSGIVLSLLNLSIEAFTFLALIIIVFITHFKISFILIALAGVLSIISVKLLSQKLRDIGGERIDQIGIFYRMISESFGSFKLIKLMSIEKKTSDIFRSINNKVAKINVRSEFLQQIPTTSIETIGFLILIVIILLVVSYVDTPKETISILTIYAVSFLRILPSMKRIMVNYNRLLVNQKALIHYINHVEYNEEILGTEELIFKKSIKLTNVSFSHGNKLVLNGINLEIMKGESVAFIGESGSGKTTLVDLIMGLMIPEQGKIFIDDKELSKDNLASWRKQIGHISQHIYLFDSSIRENVVLGREYSEEKTLMAIERAQLSKLIDEKDGLETRVGENGSLLSGGQKQRVAIASAIYQDPQIIVMDEATSALDKNTEQDIMNEIYSFSEKKTLLIIAHRVESLSKCKKVYKLEDGKLSQVSL